MINPPASHFVRSQFQYGGGTSTFRSAGERNWRRNQKCPGSSYALPFRKATPVTAKRVPASIAKPAKPDAGPVSSCPKYSRSPPWNRIAKPPLESGDAESKVPSSVTRRASSIRRVTSWGVVDTGSTGLAPVAASGVRTASVNEGANPPNFAYPVTATAEPSARRCAATDSTLIPPVASCTTKSRSCRLYVMRPARCTGAVRLCRASNESTRLIAKIEAGASAGPGMMATSASEAA